MRTYTITVMNFRTAVFMRMPLCILRERLRKQKLLNTRSLLKLNNFEVILYQFFFAEEVRLLDKINQNYEMLSKDKLWSPYILEYYKSCVRYEYFCELNRKVTEILRRS